MRVAKKIIFYTEVSNEDMENLHRERNTINEEGLVMESLESEQYMNRPGQVKVTYIEAYPENCKF